MSTGLIQSYVRGAYLVSTIRRQCSAVPAALWYYETIVWAWDAKTRERGEQLQMHDSGNYAKGALISHADICETLAMAMPDMDVLEEAA